MVREGLGKKVREGGHQLELSSNSYIAKRHSHLVIIVILLLGCSKVYR